MTEKTKRLKYAIQIENLTKDFGFGENKFKALDNINLKIEKGEFVIIMGPSGCGKTTLLNILGLLDTPTEGSYKLDNQKINELSHRKLAKIRNKNIGFVFQSFNLIPRLNVIDNVSLPLLYAGLSKSKRHTIASKILSKFELNEREYYMPWQLSGGQIQRIAIARALVNNPSIILADEPTGNLDSKSSHLIMEELYALHEQGNTIIMVTHNPNLTSYADRVITMLDGQIVSDRDNNSGEERVPGAKNIRVVEESNTRIVQVVINKNKKSKKRNK